MKPTIKLLIAALTTLSFQLQTLNCEAQDMHFSQFTMVPLQLDPSQAGKFGGDNRAIINYRNQWSSVSSNPFITYGAMYDMPFNKARKDNFFGAGISAYSDKVGENDKKNTSINIALAYHIKLDNNSYLSAGANAGFLQTSINEANLRFQSQFNGTGHDATLASGENFTNTSTFNPNFGAGVSYTWSIKNTSQVVANDGKKINAGLAIHNLAKPSLAFISSEEDNLSFRYVAHANSSFGVGATNFSLQPSFLVAYQQKATDIIIGSYFRYQLKAQSKYSQYSNGSAFSFGTHIRLGDAFIPFVLFEAGTFAFGISYDFNLSGLSTASNGQGGYEISVRFISPNPFGTRKSSARFF